jgi:uncharacterized RDD family membrane protein YckC
MQPAYGPPQTGYTTPQFGPPPVYYPPQVPVGPSGHKLAEFSDRFLARLIDGAIIGGISLVLLVPIYIVAIISLLGTLPTQTRVNGELVTPGVNPAVFFLGVLALYAAVLLVSFVINYIYNVEMMFRSGQTIGKRVMKLQVLPVDPGLTLTRGMAFKRYLTEFVSGFVPALGLIDGLWQLWDKPWRQCLHDKFAQTLVIKLNP